MDFVFEGRDSDSPLVEMVWRCRSEQAGTFMSRAASQWEMVGWQHEGKTHFTVRGPETKAKLADCPADAEFLGIVFKLGTFMPHLPTRERVDNDLALPEATGRSFWLKGSAWQVPDFDDVDTFVARLVREELLTHDPLVAAVLNDEPLELSPRTVQRRFVQATGLTQATVKQIERAHWALALLGHGLPVADVVFQTGYADQPHLTRSLKRFAGETPAQLARALASKAGSDL